MDTILDELPSARFVHVDATRLAVMDFTASHRGIGARLHFESGNTIVVNVVRLEVAKTIVEGEHTHVAAIVNVIASHDGIGVVLDPNTGERVARDFILLVHAVRVVSDVEANIFTITNITVANDGIGVCTGHANGGTHHGSASYDAMLNHWRGTLLDLQAIVLVVLRGGIRFGRELDGQVAQIGVQCILAKNDGRFGVTFNDDIGGNVARRYIWKSWSNNKLYSNIPDISYQRR